MSALWAHNCRRRKLLSKASIDRPAVERERSVSPELAARILRGIELFAEKGEGIAWVEVDRCKVSSRTHEGRSYLVVMGPDGERCQCADFSRNGEINGACLHTVAALISWAKRVAYRVERREVTRMCRGEHGMGGTEVAPVWVLVEERAGVSRELYRSDRVGEVYEMKWAVEAGEEVA